ncbi:MAG: B12-binding domain-containing radical SAM protein [Deltaproteobacteria bacterium]|nr:B12-binding domain-containing radical SAM protein [Deltaproteobacteria bacterium]MCB9488673.1 B12-binding domain-containing radical SAM protein [Deltaproteobacteria bacterium]
MKLALIYPPFYHKKFNENLPTTDDEFGLFPHIGFGWVSAMAKQTGWDVRLFEAACRKSDYNEVLRDVIAYGPDLIGFAGHATQTFRDMLLWARRFKRDMGLPQVVGGYECKAYPYEIMEHECFDYLCVGEAITFMPPFLRAFEAGSGYDKVPDLLYRDNGQLKRTHDAHHIPYSEHPFPDRSIFPNEEFYSMVSQRKNFTIGMSEVGCPYPCTFCSMRHTGFEGRTPGQLADEMEDCINNHGIHEIDYFDPIMLYDRHRAIEFAQEIQRRNLDIIWSCRARVDSLSFRKHNGDVDRELIQALADSGCRRIFFGIESGDEQVLKNIKKGKVTSNVERVLLTLEEYEIRSLGFFMIGNPGETEETVQKTISLATSLPLHYTQFTLTMIKPHTDLEKEYIFQATGIDYWREYIRGNVEEQILPTPWTELTRADLERLARKAYLSFYLRPGYMLKMILRIESWQEFQRYARVAFQMMLRPLRPEKIGPQPVWRKVPRFGLAFLDGLLANLNQGGRHPVSYFGGGVKGAWRLAMYEWHRTSTTEDVAAPGSVDGELMHPDAHTRIRKIEEFTGDNRYIPLSEGALGYSRKRGRDSVNPYTEDSPATVTVN